MLEIVVFICGAVVMILEIVGSRVLAPFLGTSIVVWTSLIGVILGCLSLGYWWGGRLADRNPSYRTLSRIILLASFFVAGVAVSKASVLNLLQGSVNTLHVGSTLAAFILFGPPGVLLGMVSPYAVRLKMMGVESSGKTVGNLYALSTVGSIMGTFLAGFFLIAYFGSTNILIVLAVVLAAASLIACLEDRPIQLSCIALCIVLFLLSGLHDRHMAAAGFHDLDTAYNRILVYPSVDSKTGRSTRVMVTGPEGIQSAMFLEDSTELALAYTKFYALAFHFRPDLGKMLMLGGGGYSFPKYVMKHYPHVKMDVVEIDPAVTSLAERFFEFRGGPGIRVFHEDARTFLNRTRDQYDVVLGDTFNSHYSIPFHVSTLEAVRRIHSLLAEDGVVISNILSAIEGDRGRFLRAEYATFKAVFPHVYLFPADPGDPSRWQNVVLVAFKSGREPELDAGDPVIRELLGKRRIDPVPADVPLLTDDYAPVDRYTMSTR